MPRQVTASRARKTRRLRRRIRRGMRRKTLRSLVPLVHYFKRTTSLGNISNFVIASGVNNGEGFSKNSTSAFLMTGNLMSSNFTYFPFCVYFTLNMLPDYNEFSALYDCYNIVGAKVTFIPFSTSSDLQSGQITGETNQNLSVLLHTCKDYDDANITSMQVSGNYNDASVQVVRQYQNYRFDNFFGKPKHTWYLKPRTASLAYNGGFGGYTRTNANTWYDMQNTDTQFYGMKGIFQVFSPNNAVVSYIHFKPEVTLYLKLKDVR